MQLVVESVLGGVVTGASTLGSPPESDRVQVPLGVFEACSAALLRIRELHPEARSMAVTSALPREGRTTIAKGLALAQTSRMGRKSVLLDLDFVMSGSANDATPSVANKRDCATGQVEWAPSGLGVLSAQLVVGGLPTGVEEVRGLTSQLLAAGLDVVADLAPLPPNGDADVLAAAFDVVVLVVRAGDTSLDGVREAVRSLRKPPVVLLNRTRTSVPRWFPIRGGI